MAKKRMVKNPDGARLVFQHVPILYALTKARKTPRLRNRILDISPSTIRAISSIAHNALLGTLPLRKRHESLVRRHQREMRIVAGKASVAKKKKLIQSGKFFPAIGALLPLAISAVTSLFAAGSKKV